MPDKVLVYSRFPKAQMVRFGERFELMDAAGKRLNEVFTTEQLSGIRAVLTAGGTPFSAETMDLMPKLGAIVCYGTGYDGVDLAAAAKRGIAVGNSPGANAASVADRWLEPSRIWRLPSGLSSWTVTGNAGFIGHVAIPTPTTVTVMVTPSAVCWTSGSIVRPVGGPTPGAGLLGGEDGDGA